MWQIKFQDAKIRVDKEQTEVDVKLQLRVGDVEFWKGELDNKLAQLKEEIEEAVSLKYVGLVKQPTRNELKPNVKFWDLNLIDILWG